MNSYKNLRKILLQELRKRRKNLEAEIETLKNEKNNLLESKNILLQEIKALDENKTKMLSEISKLENKKIDTEKKINELNEELIEKEKELESLDDKIVSNIEILDKLTENTKKLLNFKYVGKNSDGKLQYFSEDDLKYLIVINKEDLARWIQAGHIPKEIYEKIAKPNTPLPKKLYVNPREGKCWFQHHIRGITLEEKEAYDKGEKSLSEIIIGHSVHTDMRASMGEEKLVQWVFTDNTVDDYYKMYTGAHRKTKGGVMNVAHSLAIVKPSAEPSDEISKSIEEPAIDKNGAKLIEKLDLPKYSYWISPGDVGSSPYKWAYMSCFWLGSVKTGVARPDYHEYFLYPKIRNDDKILDGRFIVKCLKRPDKTARWEVWKAIADPRPADSILHKDQGYHMPIKASKLPPNKFGRENYDIKLKV